MVQRVKIKAMKKYIKIVMFQIGVDVLGFPQFYKHEVQDYKFEEKKYITKYHKSFHQTKKSYNELRLWHIKNALIQ